MVWRDGWDCPVNSCSVLEQLQSCNVTDMMAIGERGREGGRESSAL